MSRYNNINKGSYLKPNTDKEISGYLNVKYPSIPLAFSDTYVYTSRGDRYDLLAQNFYGDSNLWWIIARANPSQTPDSLIPEVGAQIRIPSKDRLSNILSLYSSLNKPSEQTSFKESSRGGGGSGY
tara:strand:- start:2108 stop:2485 length:378 start_codon:yes stop_codon:yes gene_type:complete